MRQQTLNIRIIALLLMFGCQVLTYGQRFQNYQFEKLDIIDTIDTEQLKERFQQDQIPDGEYVTQEGTYKNIRSNYLILNDSGRYLVISIQNIREFNERIINNRRFMIGETNFSHGARQIAGNLTQVCIINLEDLTEVNIPVSESLETWTYDENENSFSERKWCETKLIFDSVAITAIRVNHDCDSCQCLNSGKYIIANNELKKTHFYSETDYAFESFIGMEELYIGMSYDEFSRNHSNAQIKSVPLFEYGFGTEELGYLISHNEEPHYFVSVYEDTVAGICILNSKLTFNGLNISYTAKEIFQKHPDAMLTIDLIEHWEYIYLAELNMRLVFKTDRANRIGIYDEGLLTPTQKLKKEDAYPDFIHILPY